MPDKYHYGFDLGNGKDESCLTIFQDEEGDTQVVEAVLYGKQAEAVLACLRSRDEQNRREVEEANAEIQQLRVQLAGCLVAAEGGTKGDKEVKEGDYGWSKSYDAVVKLSRAVDLLTNARAIAADANKPMSKEFPEGKEKYCPRCYFEDDTVILREDCKHTLSSQLSRKEEKVG